MSAKRFSPSPLRGAGRGEVRVLAAASIGAGRWRGGLEQAFNIPLRPAPHPNPLPGGERGMEVLA